MRRVYGIVCHLPRDKGGGCQHPGACERLAGRYGGHDLGTCPVRMLQSPEWGVVMYYWAAAKVAPLAEWPAGYAPWLVDAMTALHSEMAQAEAKMIRSITDGR